MVSAARFFCRFSLPIPSATPAISRLRGINALLSWTHYLFPLLVCLCLSTWVLCCTGASMVFLLVSFIGSPSSIQIIKKGFSCGLWWGSLSIVYPYAHCLLSISISGPKHLQNGWRSAWEEYELKSQCAKVLALTHSWATSVKSSRLSSVPKSSQLSQYKLSVEQYGTI